MSASAGEPPSRQVATALRLHQLLEQVDDPGLLDPELREALVRRSLDAAVVYEALTWRELDAEWVQQLVAELRARLPDK